MNSTVVYNPNTSINLLLKKLEGAYADNTIRAYRSDFEVFANWCEKEGLSALPSVPDTVVCFISFDMTQSSSATIRRRMASISRIHKLARLSDPTTDEDVFLAMKRMHRQKGRFQKQAYPLTVEVIDKLIAVTDDTLKGYRDRSLLRLAYDSMRRRSELCSFQWQDLEITQGGAGILLLRFSKTDQEGFGKRIPLSKETVSALLEWKVKADLATGKILRGFRFHDQLSEELHPSHISKILKRLAKTAHLEPSIVQSISGHSARVGRAQDLLKDGKSLPQIMTLGGWRSTEIVMRYIENCDLR